MTYYEEDRPDESEKTEHHPAYTTEELNRRMMEESVYKSPEELRHEEMMEMLGGIFIQMSRVYDALMMLLEEDDMNAVADQHKNGKLLGDPPVLREDAWS